MSQNQNDWKTNSSPSTPRFSEFDPTVIPYQDQVIDDVLCNFDYSLGAHEILLSGSIGSAKSILMAHIAIRHCLENPCARVLLGRNSMPDLKATIYQKVIEHIDGLNCKWSTNIASARIRFANGSEIISRSWADRHYMKMRSLELSMAVIEELSENQTQEAYNEIKMRVGRLPHIAQNLIICATNPDAPSHWAYKYFIQSDSKTRHVYYSVTTDNPFLPKKYIEQLKKDLDPKMARRMIYGEWLEIKGEVVYYAYDKEQNYIEDDYHINNFEPIWMSFDFNIGEGKPMSACFAQYINDKFFFFDEIVLSGMRTQDVLDEAWDRGLINKTQKIFVAGDASGKHKDTRNLKSDYDIINKFLANQGVKYEMRVPQSNPPIRTRHNTVNAYCQNSQGDRRLFVYKKCKVLDEGLRLVKLKESSNLIEDDSKFYQHVTTAAGYLVCAATKHASIKPNQTIIL